MLGLTINTILQYAAVIIILIIAVLYFLKKIKQYKNTSKNCSCDSCGLYESCVIKDKKNCAETKK